MDSTSRLEKLEGVIEKFQHARLEAGRALREIKVNDLYEKAGYSKFSVYVQERFGFRSSWRSQLIKYAKVVELLEGKGNGTPDNEAQARYLGHLLDTEKEEHIPDIWELAVQRHGPSGVTMAKVKEAIDDYFNRDTPDKEEPERSKVDLKLPDETADELGLRGDDYQDGRIVPWNGFSREDLREIIEVTPPALGAFPGAPVGEPGTQFWTPLRDAEHTRSLFTDLDDDIPERIEFNPKEVQRIKNSGVPTSNQSGDEGSDALSCPEVDLLADYVPDPLTEEVLDRSGGTVWSPIFLSSHSGRWTNYDPPDEAWIGSTASRTSIQDVADALESAKDTAVKWALYDLRGKDREGLPDVDLSALDWIVIDRLQHQNYDLTVDQLSKILESAREQNVTLAVRGTFTAKLEAKPL